MVPRWVSSAIFFLRLVIVLMPCEGVCKAWKGKFGFITAMVGGIVVSCFSFNYTTITVLCSASTSDVYVNTNILPPECRGVLSAGDNVLLKVSHHATRN